MASRFSDDWKPDASIIKLVLYGYGYMVKILRQELLGGPWPTWPTLLSRP